MQAIEHMCENFRKTVAFLEKVRYNKGIADTAALLGVA